MRTDHQQCKTRHSLTTCGAICIELRTSLRQSRPGQTNAVTPSQSDGGGDRVRTDDPLLAKQVLSQLSYAPTAHPSGCRNPRRFLASQTKPHTTEVSQNRTDVCQHLPWKTPTILSECKTAVACSFAARRRRRAVVGQGGFEPPTPRLSSVCSNQLSY